jgi:hypothetical protein
MNKLRSSGTVLDGTEDECSADEFAQATAEELS